ncbi:MAG: HlyD family efflux transporter periplasmic adaptor subunit [Planctomycetales bacterium]|nr:HlyD family efflux transporter periplasmic adaptor subunit [Planctomycetales bacterium]
MSTDQSSVDAATIEKTKQQIRSLVQEIAQLSRSEMEPDQYYAEVMQRIVTALAAIGGAVWTINSERQLRLDYQINLERHLLDPKSEDSRRHVRLLQEVMTTGEARLVPPMSGAGEPDSPGNPTNTLLVLAPMKTDDSVEGVLEVFQRPDSQANSQQGYRRFLMQMSDLVGDYLKSRKLRSYSDRQSMWAKIDQFSKEIHSSLDVKDTAYTIANEGRRLIGCDRVSVTVTRGTKQVVEAISGQDTMDTRSNIVSMLRDLATRVCATGEPLWYNGSMQDLPPQVEQALETYVDESHTKSLAVLPLYRNDPLAQKADDELGAENEGKYQQTGRGDVIGSVIIEQIDAVQSRQVVAPRAQLVCEHSACALGNSLEHNNLFLMPLWRAIGQSRVLVTARYLPKTLLVSGAILAALLVMTFMPKEFELKAEGTLEPVLRKDVFFAANGEVEKVLVKHGDAVEANQVVVELNNNELLQERSKAEAALVTTVTNLDVIERQLKSLRNGGNNELLAERAKLQTEKVGYEHQLKILDDKLAKLKVRSAIDGIVTSWDIENVLKNRPVTVGQVAMQVSDPTGPWELEVYLPDNSIGHLLKARDAAKKDELPVNFVLKSHTGDSFKGTLAEVQETAALHDEHGQSYRCKVSFDKNDVVTRLNLEVPKQGTEVVAKIECGKRSMAYCLFHELLEWVQLRLFAL